MIYTNNNENLFSTQTNKSLTMKMLFVKGGMSSGLTLGDILSGDILSRNILSGDILSSYT